MPKEYLDYQSIDFQVVYNARGFLEKNRDNLSTNLIECMEKSTISHLFANLPSSSSMNFDDGQKNRMHGFSSDSYVVFFDE